MFVAIIALYDMGRKLFEWIWKVKKEEKELLIYFVGYAKKEIKDNGEIPIQRELYRNFRL